MQTLYQNSAQAFLLRGKTQKHLKIRSYGIFLLRYHRAMRQILKKDEEKFS